mgnify:CR=1 FL=1
MAMVVKNNMSAVRTLGTLNRNSEALAKSLERVSSGQKLNSAADDNSGYSISERMRVRIRSLDQADQNTQNGASMLKVAGGAVDSTVEILRTMKEKAINAANDSNTDSDRATIQKELDQSIDQVDDNALVTYNGKYLVDGSKMAKGVATKTSLTNNSFSTDTTGRTKFVDLKDRNGNNLNIQTTDRLTLSYVVEGNNYTFDIDIDGNTTLNSVLLAAAEPFTRNSPAGRGADRTYDSSCAQAQSTYDSSVAAATAVYNGATSNTLSSYNSAVTARRNAATTYSNNVTSMSSFLSNYNSLMGTSLSASTFSQYYSVFSGLGSGTPALASYNNIVSSYSTAISDYNFWSTELSSVRASAATVQSSSVRSASTVLMSALSTAASTLGDSLGQLVPYQLTVDETDVIGKDAAGDTVYTADRKNAITIRAASAGVSYQISGLTFRVSDSKGQVKKSVNAVLDNFSESVRALNKSNDNALTLHVGDKANVSIRVGLTDMRSEALGLKSSTGKTLSVGNQTNANAAVNVLDNAIQKALNQQTDIGAVSSRMEQTSNNLHIARDNVQASESVIRDADMAKEMTEYTRNNVLLQAAQSMLAQANQNSSSVLGLLQ